MSNGDPAPHVRRHLRFGWTSLLVYLAMGIALESLHAFKLRWYLDVGNETRRLLLTLAHAHGVLLALVNVVFALSLKGLPESRPRRLELASSSLIAATVLLPGGFLLGGIVIYDGDPGLGVLLVPVGALLLLVGVALMARGAGN